MRASRSALLLFLSAGLGCRADPGQADYSDQVGLRERAAGPEFLPGPDPFDGSPRLNPGIFYEGGSTESTPIDGVTTAYFIFDTAGDGTGSFTYSQETSSDRVEGTFSDRIIHSGLTFLGGGIFYFVARDFSRYESLNVSLKSEDGAFADVTITVQYGPDRPAMGPDPVTNVGVSANAYGYTNDGEWHTLRIPFSDLIAQGFDASQVRSPFFIQAGGGGSGESLLIDNLYIE